MKVRTIKKMTLKQLEFDFNAPKPKKSKFWKIGIYSIYREQGGDEEGGWAYDQMELVKGLKKSFTNKADAFKWARRINNLPSFKNQRGFSWEARHGARVFFRGLPNDYPKNPPYYS